MITPFIKIAVLAGIGKIVRPFDNMRAGRATEVARDYGVKAESVWIGHSEEIAKKHYLMVTGEDYAAVASKRVTDSQEQD